jgi:hypothetical protein
LQNRVRHDQFGTTLGPQPLHGRRISSAIIKQLRLSGDQFRRCGYSSLEPEILTRRILRGELGHTLVQLRPNPHGLRRGLEPSSVQCVFKCIVQHGPLLIDLLQRNAQFRHIEPGCSQRSINHLTRT